MAQWCAGRTHRQTVLRGGVGGVCVCFMWVKEKELVCVCSDSSYTHAFQMFREADIEDPAVYNVWLMHAESYTNKTLSDDVKATVDPDAVKMLTQMLHANRVANSVAAYCLESANMLCSCACSDGSLNGSFTEEAFRMGYAVTKCMTASAMLVSLMQGMLFDVSAPLSMHDVRGNAAIKTAVAALEQSARAVLEVRPTAELDEVLSWWSPI